MRRPFTLYKEKTKSGTFWYARFWDDTAQKYAHSRSTKVPVEGKKERRYEAEEAARAIHEKLLLELANKPTHVPVHIPVANVPLVADTPFIEYLENFWNPNSAYVKEQATIRKNPLSAYYVKQNAVNIQHHVKPYTNFTNLPLQKLTAGMIKDWMAWIADKGTSGRTINSVLSTLRVAVHYAIDREELDRDPFARIKQAAETSQEKGVITFAERAKLLIAKSTDLYSRLAVLLGLLCGLRRGEVRGLKWGDFNNGLIRLTHNFIDHEGLKKPKRGKIRTVPYPFAVEEAFEDVRKIAKHNEPEDFVFDSYKCPGVPMGETFFRNAIRRELEAIGISENEQEERNLTFHSLRHSFITLGRLDGITDLEIQAIAGHSTRRMMERYSHAEKVIDFIAMREKLNKAVEMRIAQ